MLFYVYIIIPAIFWAEGIEDLEQFKRLKDGGCDYIQGYLFSKPLFEEEIEEIYNCNFLEHMAL